MSRPCIRRTLSWNAISQGNGSTTLRLAPKPSSSKCSKPGFVMQFEKRALKGSLVPGGVFMNVKANLTILELDEVEDMYVFPSLRR